MWGNPEHHIYQVSTAYHVNIRTATMCKQPLIPLRANQNSTHWLLHPAYTDKMKDSCVEGYEEDKVAHTTFPLLSSPSPLLLSVCVVIHPILCRSLLFVLSYVGLPFMSISSVFLR